MSYFSKSLVAVAAIVASATSFAAPLAEDTIAGDFTMGDTAIQSFRAVINGQLSFTAKAGEIGVTGIGLSSFAAYCYDPTVTLNLPGSYDVSEVALDGVARLFKVSGFNGLAYGTDGVDSVTKTVALQLAIWEVALDGLSSADLTAGNFSFDPSVTRVNSENQILHAFVDPNAKALAQTYLSQASALTGGYYPNVRLFTPADGTTNQALVTTVPEPSTYALMAACLGVVGFVARRKSA